MSFMIMCSCVSRANFVVYSFWRWSFRCVFFHPFMIVSTLWAGKEVREMFISTVLLKSNASEIRWISTKIDEILHLSNFLRKFFCFILYEISLSPLKFRWENSKRNFVRSNIRFEFSNSMCMKLRSFDWLYNVNNSITKTVKVRHRLHVILFCLSHWWSSVTRMEIDQNDSYCTYKSGYIPPNTSR